MFASLLRPKKTRARVSETTPLLAALSKYRAHHSHTRAPDEPAHGLDDDDDGHGDDDDNDNDLPYAAELDDEDDDARRDGPLLPVFSAELLGPSAAMLPPASCLLPPFPSCVLR